MLSSLFRRMITVLWLAVVPLTFVPSVSSAQVSVGISVNIAPPVLPVYVQPAVPAPGYVWTPGYWAWGGAFGYYWVPGTWVAPPAVGLLWTPGYWGWAGGAYVWHAGYWGPHVGFYGGVNYGFGYTGHGYWGGRWRGGTFVYNRAVTNVTNVNVTNVYARAVAPGVNPGHLSFNGGPGGIVARPTRAELVAAHEHHIAFTPLQRRHLQLAARNPALRASVNGGRPAIAATARPGGLEVRHGNPAAGRLEPRAGGFAAHGAQPHAAPKAHAAQHGGRAAPRDERGKEGDR